MTHFLISFDMREIWPVLNCVSIVLMQNLDIWNFHSSLALNNGKLAGYFKSLLVCHCVTYDSFLHSVWYERKNGLFELCVSPVLTQNKGIWNFYVSLTLNNGKLI